MDTTSGELLLIEGDPVDATTVLRALSRHGQPDVECVQCLSEGLERLERPGVVAILLNLFLPDSKGIETLDKVLAAAGHVPILVLCGADHEHIGRLAVEHGADDFLPSDHFDSYSLTRAVGRMLERSTNDDALFVEKERAEVTLNSIGDAVLSTDISGNVSYLNAAAEYMTGWSLSEASGHPFAEIFNLIDGTTRAPAANPMALAVRENRTVSLPVNCTLIRRDGHEFPIEDSAAPIRDRGGRITGAVIVFHDVSGARQMAKPEMVVRAVERQFIEGSLSVALARHEFALHYQPKIDLASKAIVGVEALLRWRHPERGFIPPAHFVPIAEETGLILPIGQWVVREACRQSRAWLDAGLPPLPMAVNISAIEFRRRDFLERIRAILDETRLDPQCLELELTESVLMVHAESTVSMLKSLKNLGVQLTVDDFGTGYSSLSYLRQFPVDSLKVDRSFVHEISSKSDDAVIVRAVISMGNSLKKRVIAEGVETREQLDFLTAAGCEEAQGYYFNPPMVAEQLAALLEAGDFTNVGSAPHRG
jgi:PAS domain S-box-containing protein